MSYADLQIIEAFHLSFLDALTRKLPPEGFALKGGSNLRFFFGSDRFSEDMDLDVEGVEVHKLQERVMKILDSRALISGLRRFGVEEVVPPVLSKAKQTETMHRFKAHLITERGGDLPTKIEFSRRGLEEGIRAEALRPEILAAYQIRRFIAPHYTAPAAARQKIQALAARRNPQPRDVFDLFVLSARAGGEVPNLPADDLRRARERALAMTYEQYRDTVVAFLGLEDQRRYDSAETWDEIRLVVVALIEGGIRGGF